MWALLSCASAPTSAIAVATVSSAHPPWLAANLFGELGLINPVGHADAMIPL